MADLVPAGASLLAPLTDPAGGPPLVRLQGFIGQPAVKKALPWFLGIAALGGAGLSWAMLAPAAQRLLYAQLDDSERASVTASLDKGQIRYRIDPDSGALTVDESDLYKARMLVAQNGALATPDTTSDALDKLPMGASRALESQRLLAAREHELMLTIKEIDGVEAVRVQIADAEKSVFVRDNIAPSASVMLRLADGRQLSQGQVSAIVNLVAGSVQGMTPDAVRVADQHGHLLSDRAGGADSDRLEMQSRLENKLRDQVDQLLTPMLGDGNFSSQIQVDLDMDQVTSARESYDKAGALRSETQQQSQTSGAPAASGVPGVLSNTPPPSATASPGAPTGTLGAPTGTPGAPTGTPGPAASSAPANGESSASRNYELGREVAVSNATPGKIKRLSVAVALSARAMKKARASDIDQIRQLVSAAVGADRTRGDQVAVIVRGFDADPIAAVPFYETSWFAMAARYGAALLAVVLVLLLGVRPLIRALKSQAKPISEPREGEDSADSSALPAPPTVARITDPRTGAVNAAMLGRHVGIAQQIVEEKPENAVLALRQMLAAQVNAAAT